MGYAIKYKNEVLEIFLKWRKLVENHMSKNIKVLLFDNGGEYVSDPFKNACVQ